MNDKINEAMDQIGNLHLLDSIQFRRRRPYWIYILAAVIGIGILVLTFLDPRANAEAISTADYEARVEYPREEICESQIRLTDFWVKSLCQVLSDGDSENQAFSPVNLYMAMAATAELSGGDQQILSLLGVDSLEDVRSQAHTIWNGTYRDDPKWGQCLPANSLWLDQDLIYSQPTMDILAQRYYTSVYQGNFGSAATNRAIANWIDEQTNDFLANDTEGIDLDPDTVFALYSTLFYQAQWEYPFRSSLNIQDVFHSPTGDVTCTYMRHIEMTAPYYWGDSFVMVRLYLKGGCKMWLLLPDEGKTIQQVLSDPNFASTIFSNAFEGHSPNSKYVKINLSIPKFDISASGNLIEDLKAMGITNVFNENTADFSAITGGGYPVRLSRVNQATRVAIDEAGVTAASYVEVSGLIGGNPPNEIVDFVLNRPFLFVVTNNADIPLFAGTVVQP